jgi:hypothetical protein
MKKFYGESLPQNRRKGRNFRKKTVDDEEEIPENVAESEDDEDDAEEDATPSDDESYRKRSRPGKSKAVRNIKSEGNCN